MMNCTTLLKTSVLLVVSAALTACGGTGAGGGTDVATPATPASPTTPSAAVPTLANAQGFWSATLSGTSSASAVILPNGQAWVVYQTGSTVSALAQATLSLNGSSYNSSGKYYRLPYLPGGAVQDYSFSASLTAGNTGSLASSITVGAGAPTAVTWTYNKAYETPASQSSVQGRWSGIQGADSLLWDLDAAGKLAGTSTTGCTYSGTITPNANPVAVLDVAIFESCAGTSQNLAGMATLNADKTRMSLAYTTAAGAQGGVVSLGR